MVSFEELGTLVAVGVDDPRTLLVLFRTTMDVSPRWVKVVVKVSLTCVKEDRCLKRGDEKIVSWIETGGR